MNADDHALVNIVSRLTEELPAILSALQSEGCDASVGESQQRPLVPSLNFRGNLGPVRIEDGVEDGRPPRGRQHRAPQSEHTPRGHQVLDDAHALALVQAHVLQFALPLIEQVDDASHVLLRDADFHGLPRLLLLPGLFVRLVNDGRRSDLKFESLPPHSLDEDRQVELSPSAHHVLVRRLRLVDLKRHIPVQLLEEPFTNHA
mmetsp:Transcript_49363/g.91430  ORF Transcript_49363/g.91430 Transcript_49363/m.91430 type:complete len:203 (+) Transcript_49363:281-889(+)